VEVDDAGSRPGTFNQLVLASSRGVAVVTSGGGAAGGDERKYEEKDAGESG
jgi:hypothetical protein